MYTLLSGLYKYMFQKDEYCILILGLDNAGKTTFLEQSKTRFNKNYKGMSLSKITTTVGLNIGTVDVGKARLMFWDLGGQEELQSLWDKNCVGTSLVWAPAPKSSPSPPATIGPAVMGGFQEQMLKWSLGAQHLGSGQRVVATPCPSTMQSATASSTSSIPRMRRGFQSPSERLRRWSRVRRWTVSPSWCWPTSRTLRLASRSLTSRLRSATAPPRSAGATA
ncbi:ADP-ribosylation factor-related protein 1 isoform X1 [Leptonychotes weddellii]|uniref:ADP-ribosylation factor-related protein 1 isoform X1 n=1 Tax=Leptonychotes weddellii TaxID=9713 RepID=A0A7F8RQC6_LEPWE|nr:ADP-ribosylation factor-related protein 1 isoform X1 [Leptonychotes weddellii]